MAEERAVKRPKLNADAAPSACSSCESLEVAMRAQHPGCILKHKTAAAAVDEHELSDYVGWLHDPVFTEHSQCHACFSAMLEAKLTIQIKDCDLEVVMKARCLPCLRLALSSCKSAINLKLFLHSAGSIAAEGIAAVRDMLTLLLEYDRQTDAMYFMQEVWLTSCRLHAKSSTVKTPADLLCIAHLVLACLTAGAAASTVYSTALQALVRYNCIGGIERVVQQYCTPADRVQHLTTALEHCLKLDTTTLDTVNKLLKLGADVLPTKQQAASVLHCMFASTEKRYGLDAGKDKSSGFISLLLNHAATQQADGSESLLLHQDASGDTALHLAARRGYCGHVTQLLQCSASAAISKALQVRNSSGSAAVHVAAEQCCQYHLDGSSHYQSHSSVMQLLVQAAHTAGCLHELTKMSNADGVSVLTMLLRLCSPPAVLKTEYPGELLKVRSIHLS